MDIIFLTSSDTRSGGSRQALYLAQGLAERGHKVTFFVPHTSTLPTVDPDMNWRFVPKKEFGKWRAEVEKALPPAGMPCILHAFHNKGLKLASLWGLSLRKRGVVVLGNRGVCFRPGNPLPYWSPGLDAVTVNSQACGKVLSSILTPKKKIKVVYNGIPEGRVVAERPASKVRAELGLPEGRLVFGTVAGNKPVKGVKEFIEAIAQARELDAHFVMIGTSPEKWAPLAEEHGVADRITFIAHTPQVADYLQIFDAFVLPSLSESMPNTLLEAYMAGLPVVATSVGGVPELIQGNGLLIPPGKPGALADALREMTADETRRKAWGQKSLELAANFTLDRKIDRIESLYRELLAERGLAVS